VRLAGEQLLFALVTAVSLAEAEPFSRAVRRAWIQSALIRKSITWLESDRNSWWQSATSVLVDFALNCGSVFRTWARQSL
jgi:hypothetical protein